MFNETHIFSDISCKVKEAFRKIPFLTRIVPEVWTILIKIITGFASLDRPKQISSDYFCDLGFKEHKIILNQILTKTLLIT
jgi:hypothetical protein